MVHSYEPIMYINNVLYKKILKFIVIGYILLFGISN